MPYITLAEIKAALPVEITAQLLDDGATGVPDATVWPEVVAAVSREIDGKIGQRYALPLAEPVPALIRNAAFALAAELVYQRRGFFGDANPWTKRADGIRGTAGQQGGQPGLLDKLATGETVLLPTLKPQASPAIAITAPAKTTPARGGLLC